MTKEQILNPQKKVGADCLVVVTRPRKQLEDLLFQLTHGLEQASLKNPLLGLPLLEIEPISDANLSKDLLIGLEGADLIVFVSPNAVICAKDLLGKYGYAWPSNARVAVVGGGTEQAIRESGLLPKELIKPAQSSTWDSEGLWESLRLSKQSWSGAKVVFVKGLGGRHWLMDKFTQSGAIVEPIEVYKRVPLLTTDLAWSNFAKAYEYQKKQNLNQNYPQSIWLLTSSEAVLQIPNSLEKLGVSVDYLNKSQAICSHERIKQAALDIGFGAVKLCEPGDLNLVNATIELLDVA